MKQMLTVNDLAELLKVPIKSVYRAHSLGYVPRAKRIGGMLRWEASAIDRWLKRTGRRR